MKKLFFFILTVLLIACKKEPSASFSYTGKFEAGETIQFTNTSSNADSYSWNFGDGTLSTEESPSHIFEKPGNYRISLTAMGHGKNVTANKDISITGTTFTLTNGTGATMYSFFTFFDNGHYIQEYNPLGVLNVGQKTRIIKTDHNKISFGWKFTSDGSYFINYYPFYLSVGAHNDKIITDTITIVMVSINSGFLKEPGRPGILSRMLENK